MKTNQLAASLAEAIHALDAIADDDFQELSLIDCARIVYALPPTPELARIRGRLACRLQRQLSASWVEQGNAYEVFSVLIALWQYQPVYVTGEHLAATLRRLIAAERAVGGPYYFENADAIPVNAQIAIFMRLVAKPLPNVDAFLAQAVADGRFGGTRSSRADLIYLLAQAAATPKLIDYVKDHWTRKSWQTPLRIATALTLLHRSAPPPLVHHALAVLCDQQRNGLWEDCALTATAGQSTTFVTTAIVIGVLTRHQPQARTTTIRFRKRQKTIISAACRTFAHYAEPLRSSAIDTVTHVGSADKDFEITQLSILFADALKTPTTLTERQHTKLGLASLFGWVAYTIYDDFLDSAGTPAKLPVANIAMRTSMDYFRSALPAHAAFVRYAADSFSMMDEANAWEVEHCRFAVHGKEVTIGELPRYGQRTILATRSYAHTLAPMATLWERAYSSRPINTCHIKTAFTHYLIARQLSDDLHDWAEDIEAGQASYVVAAILRDMRVKPGVYRLSDLLPAMQKSFRRTVLPKVCEHILRHAALSRQEFQKSGLLHTDNNLYALLDRLEVVAQYSLDMRNKSFTFYEASKTTRFK